jgi:hypothetical protein
MAAILWYCLKVVLTSAALFLYYQLFLRDKTFHHYNRFYLLGSVLVSLLLPLSVTCFTVQVTNKNYLLLHQLQQGSAMEPAHMYNPELLLLSFALIAAVLTGRFMMGILKIRNLKKRFPKEALEDVNLYMTDLEHAPFSYFKNLFWKHTISVDSGLGKQILEHEMVHIRERHTYDKIFMEIARSVFWFNPFFYLIKKEVHLIHEYLADKKAVEHSDTRVFAQMLLASHFSANAIPATSALLNPHLKKRLAMLKTATTRFSYARKVFVLPLLSAVVFASVVHIQHTQAEANHLATLQSGDRPGKTTAIAQPFTAIHIKKSSNCTLQQDNKEKLKDRQQEAGRTTAAGQEKDYMTRHQEATVAHDEAMVIHREAMVTHDEAMVTQNEAITIHREAMVAQQQAMVIKQKATVIAQQAAIARQQAERIKEQTKNL